jgi:hypothetical protein
MALLSLQWLPKSPSGQVKQLEFIRNMRLKLVTKF